MEEHAPNSAKIARVLIVEDDPAFQKIVSTMLEKSGIVPVLASSAGDALQHLGKEHYHLVLMDVRLPDSSGLELARAIREREKHSPRHTLIMGITAEADGDIRRKCLESGMDGFMAKPFNREKLLGIVKRIVL
jgi:CheY-like chemotaxis protein